MPSEPTVLEGFTLVQTPHGVSIKKKRAPLFETMWLFPFALLCPILAVGAGMAVYACLSDVPHVSGLAVLGRLALAAMFLAAGIVPVWGFWVLLVIVAPVVKTVSRVEAHHVCTASMFGAVYARKYLDEEATVVLQVYDSKGDPCVRILLRDKFVRVFKLTIPTVVGSSETEAAKLGGTLAQPMAELLGASFVCEYPQMKK
ncbi:MAG: hypothetical protein ABIG44_05175 [Planctomycetota bacterium]